MGSPQSNQLLVVRGTAVLAVFGASTSAILAKLSGVAPFTSSFYRLTYAVPVLGVLAWLGRQTRRARRERILAFVSGFLLALDITLFHIAIGDIGAGLASVVVQTQVAFVALLGWLIHRERLGRLTVPALAVAAAGILLMSGLGGDDVFGDHPLRGVLLGVAAGLAFAAFLMLFRASNRSMAPPAAPLFDASLGAAVGVLAFGLPGGEVDLVPSWPAHGWLLLLALIVQVGAWLLFTHVLSRLATVDTSAIILLHPVLSLGWALAIFDEPITAVQWSGAALIVVGVALANTRSEPGQVIPSG